MRYRISRPAKRDLDDIFLYWAKRAGLTVADRLIENITSRFWFLGEYPQVGRSQDDLGTGVKCFPAGKYLIYFRKTKRSVEILHVFHGAQDQRRALKRAVKR